MMNRYILHKILFVIVGFTLSVNSMAQVGVGSWRDYLPYSDFKTVVDADGMIYAATDNSILQIDKDEKSVKRISKLTGLSDSRITDIEYHEKSKTLLVGYKDGKIDLLDQFGITSISDIERSDIIADKSINKFTINDDEVFISTGFGIVRFDLDRREVRDTYIIGNNGSYEEVYDLSIFKDSIYVATPLGLKSAWFNDPLLSFYETWTYKFNDRGVDKIASNDTRILIRQINSDVVADTMLEYVGSQWVVSDNTSGFFVRDLSFDDDKLLLSRDGAIVIYNSNWDTLRLETNYGDGRIANPNSALLNGEIDLWVADAENGVVNIPKKFIYDIFKPESPRTINAERITFQNQNMLIATGGKTESWSNTFIVDGVFKMDESNSWSEYNSRFDTNLNDVRDYIAIDVNPFNKNEFAVGSLGKGLLVFNDNGYQMNYDSLNSTLKSRSINENHVSVTGVAYDDNGNLWCGNSLTDNVLSVLQSDSTWTGFNFAGILEPDVTGDLILANDGSKWLTLPNKGKGILVFNDRGTINDFTDDEKVILNASIGSGGLPSSNIYSIAKDNEGEIWVGTDQGVGVFFSPSSVFGSGNFDAQRPLVSLGGFLQYLLESETVTAIAVDGANRKWFGTSNSGVFLMSSDGTKELLHFTSENSPLLSNTIKTIAVNPNNGEVVISTDRGVVAYRGTATQPDASFSNVKVFPNPVYEDFNGLIAIEGLAVNSRVRITDINGQVVFETYSEGGQAVWNGKRMDGENVSAGVYLVFALDDENIESQVSKILMIK